MAHNNTIEIPSTNRFYITLRGPIWPTQPDRGKKEKQAQLFVFALAPNEVLV